MNNNSTSKLAIGIIPARMGSSRFPGKPLAPILDLPMVGHVYLRSKMSSLLKEVYVATCDSEIADYIESIGGKSILTKKTHERASDRTAEAILKIEQNTGEKVDIVVMIQGDEPMLNPEMIDESIQAILSSTDINVANLMSTMNSISEFEDKNEIKVVVDLNNYALYFSRKAIPTCNQLEKNSVYKQVCIIPFRRDFLMKYNSIEPTPLEKLESIDMLRCLEHGYKVKMVLTKFETYSVDTPEDLKKVEQLMKKDNLLIKYISNI